VTVESEADLALLRIKGDAFPLLPLAAGPAERGQGLYAVTKDGIGPSACVGEDVDGTVGAVTMFRALGLGPGASGGPLVNVNGRVVGVIRGGFEDGDQEGVAIPVGRLIELLDRARRPEEEP
jgi:S1-C subfamily serine protease